MTESPYAPPPPPPPTPWPYATGPRAAAPTALAIATVALSVLFAAVTVIRSLTAWSAADDYREAYADGQRSIDVFTWYDGLSLLILPVMVAVYVVACLWLQEARKETDPARHTRRSAWVWFGWWVPIVSLWFPYQVVRDIRDGSGDAYRTGLGLWWASWLITLSLGRVSSALVDDESTVDALPTVETIEAIACVLACVLWCRIVLSITNGQKTLLAQR